MKLSPNDGNLNDQMRNYGSQVLNKLNQKTVRLPKNAGVSNIAKQNNYSTQFKSFDTDESPRGGNTD